MNKITAVAALNTTVFYWPETLPSEITWQTPVPSGTLTEVAEKVTKIDNKAVSRAWGTVNGNTLNIDRIFHTSGEAKAALKTRYQLLSTASVVKAAQYSDLATAVDAIGVDPNPPVEEPDIIEIP